MQPFSDRTAFLSRPIATFLCAAIVLQNISSAIELAKAGNVNDLLGASAAQTGVSRTAKASFRQEAIKSYENALKSKRGVPGFERARILIGNDSQPKKIDGLDRAFSGSVESAVRDVLGTISDSGTSVKSLKATGKKRKLELRKTGAAGKGHTRLRAWYDGLEVVWSDLVAHTDGTNRLRGITGWASANMDVDTKPTVRSNEAASQASRSIRKQLERNITADKDQRLVVYALDGTPRLAWKITSDGTNGKRRAKWVTYVDAKNGSVLRQYDNIQHDLLETPTELDGSLLDNEAGTLVSLTGSTSDGTIFTLLNTWANFQVFNASADPKYSDAGTGAYRDSTHWTMSDQAEISAAYNMAKTLDFYRTLGTFGVDKIAFSESGRTTLPVYVHVEEGGQPMANAYWDGNGVYIGDGDATMRPLAVMDVMAHEFTHAWTENTSNLVYQNEPGALNESFSDIMGTMAEFYAQEDDRGSYPNRQAGKADWLIGEDVMTETVALRDMRNPANTDTVGTGGEAPTRYLGTYWWTNSGDNGGVHTNSSVQNYFFYLLTEGGKGNNDGILFDVQGVGRTVAEQIAYRANSAYMTSTSGYAEARQAWIDAANELYPWAVANVEAAWSAVGVDGLVSITGVTPEESFETGALPDGWTTETGTLGWTIDSSTGALGTSSLKAATIDHSGSTAVQYEWTFPEGFVSFYRKVSSEQGYDTLRMDVDGDAKGEWSGESDWMPTLVRVGPGPHTLKWTYSKDSSESVGLDTAWIDGVHLVSFSGAFLSVSNQENGIPGTYQSGSSLLVQGSRTDSGSYMVRVVLPDGTESITTERTQDALGIFSFPIDVSGMPEKDGLVEMQYVNADGLRSPLFQSAFRIDRTAPGSVTLGAPTDETSINAENASGGVHFEWNDATDPGENASGIGHYDLELLDQSGSVTQTYSVMGTGITLPLMDGTYGWRVTSFDRAENRSTPGETRHFTLDTTAPFPAGEIAFTGADSITGDLVLGHPESLIVMGRGSETDSGAIANLWITDGTGNVYASGTLDASGTFSIPASIAGLRDGMLRYSVQLVDEHENRSEKTNGYLRKSVEPINGRIAFPSGIYSRSTESFLQVLAGKPVEFTLSGDGLAQTLTGRLDGSGQLLSPITLSAGDGEKRISAVFRDEAQVESNLDDSIILDTKSPSVTYASTGTAFSTGTATISGTVDDENGIVRFEINGDRTPVASNWSKDLSLAPGKNDVRIVATDAAGNKTDVLATYMRVAKPSVTFVEWTDGNGTLRWNTDFPILASIRILDGSSVVDKSDFSLASSGTMALTYLSGATTYGYEVSDLGNDPSFSFIGSGSFRTSDVIPSNGNADAVNATGSVRFADASGSGANLGSGGLLFLRNANGNGSFALSLDGLSITASGGDWDGRMFAPEPKSQTIAIPETGFVQTGSVYEIGHPGVSLAFSGRSATVSLPVPNGLNGRTLRVYRSEDRTNFAPISSCVVVESQCVFQTDRFSQFAFGLPTSTDTSPDEFTLTGKTKVPVSTNIDSDPITIVGINAPTSVTVSGGLCSINGNAFTGATGNVSEGDVIKIRIMSSEAYGTAKSMELNVGGMKRVFTVTTLSPTPTGSSFWGGGGGGGSSFIPALPKPTLGNLGSESGSTASGSIDASGKSAPTKPTVWTKIRSIMHTGDSEQRLEKEIVQPIQAKVRKITQDENRIERYFRAIELLFRNKRLRASSDTERSAFRYLEAAFGTLAASLTK